MRNMTSLPYPTVNRCILYDMNSVNIVTKNNNKKIIKEKNLTNKTNRRGKGGLKSKVQ